MNGSTEHPLALELNSVRAGYDRHDILKDVNLSVEEGEFLGIIGPNGGGKTTLLKVILGLLKPTRGTVKVLGTDPAKARKLIGYVPQYIQYDRQFPIRVMDVVLMGRLGKLGWNPFFSPKDREAALDALAQVQMEEFMDQQLSQLSGGQQQRVLIARALCTEPRLILLDEPTASIDRKMQSSIYELLRDLNRDSTIILVTHDIGVLSTYVKKIGCINKYFIYHGSKELTNDMLEAAYECPVDLIAHGVPHRVFSHGEDGMGGEQAGEGCGDVSPHDCGKHGTGETNGPQGGLE
jgi:zinc transport system ATP-binding protein